MIAIDSLVSELVSGLEGLNKSRSSFLTKLFKTGLGLRGRYNFTHLARYMGCTDKTIRSHFSRAFDFLGLNLKLLKTIGIQEGLLALDASFIRKAGKKTFGLDFFYNADKQMPSRGLEISTLALIDRTSKWAFNLQTFQTPNIQTKDSDHTRVKNRMDFYIERLDSWLPKVKHLASYLAADGFYCKTNFFKAVRGHGLHLITKMRCDANLYYLYQGEQKQTGRPRIKAGKVNWDQPDLSYFKVCATQADYELLYADLYHVHTKQVLRVCMVRQQCKSIPTHRYALICSTDLQQDPKQIYQDYRLRFQIEFCFRDAKQHCGLQHCQSRKEARLNFHFNLSMTILNIAKASAFHQKFEPFSMASIKTKVANSYIVHRVIRNLALELSSTKLQQLLDSITPIGTIAA